MIIFFLNKKTTPTNGFSLIFILHSESSYVSDRQQDSRVENTVHCHSCPWPLWSCSWCNVSRKHSSWLSKGRCEQHRQARALLVYSQSPYPSTQRLGSQSPYPSMGEGREAFIKGFFTWLLYKRQDYGCPYVTWIISSEVVDRETVVNILSHDKHLRLISVIPLFFFFCLWLMGPSTSLNS